MLMEPKTGKACLPTVVRQVTVIFTSEFAKDKLCGRECEFGTI